MDSVADKLEFLGSFADVFRERFMNPLWKQYLDIETNHWDSISLFLDGYAFERQGRDPSYSHVATDIIEQLKGDGQLFNTDWSDKAWKIFREKFNSINTNYRNNPLCPTDLNRDKLSIARFAIKKEKPLVYYLKELLKRNMALEAHEEIKNVRGIGVKIASLFLRDIAIYYDLNPSKDRHLLQPVDIWVGRAVENLGGPKYENEKDVPKEKQKQNEKIQRIQEWMIKNSEGIAKPENMNQGMWYFATQVAGSKYRLERCLRDLSYAKKLTYQHKQALYGAAKCITLV